MKRLLSLSLMLVLLAMASVPAIAATDTASGTARARLDHFAAGLHSLSGRFHQTMTDGNGHKGQVSEGKVALQAPRQFRWETATPYEQLIVADGSHVWVYEPDLEQVTVRQQSTAEAHSPLTVLTDVSRLDKDFNSRDMGTRDNLAWLRLTPRSGKARITYTELGFDAEGLRAMVFKDQLGNVTRIRFSDWQRNTRLPASTFQFTPPKGVDVVGDVDSVPDVNPLKH